MEYITARRSETLLNEPYEITYADIRRMYYENLRDAEECRRVTESSRRGETYYANDGRPGEEKIADFLDKKCNAINLAIAKKEQLIEKLESYKKSLIYECVTGKKEVN